jgi:hypothetical protein
MSGRSWLKEHAFGEVFKGLREDLQRCLDQQVRPLQAVFLELSEDLSDFAPALPFVIAVVAFGQAAQAGDEGGSVRQAIGADALRDTGSQNLLRAAAADAEHKFHRRPVDEGAGKASSSRITSLILLYQRGLAGTGNYRSRRSFWSCFSRGDN